MLCKIAIFKSRSRSMRYPEHCCVRQGLGQVPQQAELSSHRMVGGERSFWIVYTETLLAGNFTS